MPKSDKYALQKEFARFTTGNVNCFADNTYFLVSMTSSEFYNDVTEFLLYPGGEARFQQNPASEIPQKFRDPNDPQKIHPDLQITIRRKSHRVFHEQFLGHHISIGQTLLPHPSVDLFTTRGGGAKLINGKLYPQYKSGVLNGKWSLPFIGEDLSYGILPVADRSAFNQQLQKLPNVEVALPVLSAKESLEINSSVDSPLRAHTHNYNKNRAIHNELEYSVAEKNSILTADERKQLCDLKGDRLKSKILNFITVKLNSCTREDLGMVIQKIQSSGEYALLERRQNPYFLGKLFKPQTDSITQLNQLIDQIIEQEHLTWSNPADLV